MANPFSGTPDRSRWQSQAAVLVLVILTFFVYNQITDFDFINYDDPQYVTKNPKVMSGLVKSSIMTAFTSFHAANWHPLTWLSHMADVTLFGLNPAGHHLTNLLLHLLNTLMLYFLLYRMTGQRWPGMVVAALFAVHPLHVESVAWIAERKDVLCGFFFMGTLLSYQRYVKHPGMIGYIRTIALFAMALMAKPMAVTLPFVLLLLDFWPLSRLAPDTVPQKAAAISWKLILEKIPFFLLTVVSCTVTWFAQSHSGAVTALSRIPLDMRMANAAVSTVNYITKTIWPVDLAIFYPYPNTLAGWRVSLSTLVIIGTTLSVVWFARRLPYLAVGWFWFLGMLVPVIGIVQVGAQSMADRYTYLPLIGLFIMAAWGFGIRRETTWHRWTVRCTFVMVAVVMLSVAARTQVGRWKDTATLFRHAIAVTPPNAIAHQYLGFDLAGKDRFDEAKFHYRTAINIKPDYASAYNSLGVVLAIEGNLEEANASFSKALRIKPHHPEVHNNLGVVLERQHRLEDAIFHFREAVRTRPDYLVAHRNLARVQKSLRDSK